MIDENSYRTTIKTLKNLLKEEKIPLESERKIIEIAIPVVEFRYHLEKLADASGTSKKLRKNLEKGEETNEDSSDRPSAGETGKDAGRGRIRAEHPEEHPVPMGERQEECGGVHAPEAG